MEENKTLPSYDDIENNVPFWKNYAMKTKETAEYVEKTIKEIEKRNIATRRIEKLFNQHVKPNYPMKKFSKEKIQIRAEDSYEYSFDNVLIGYLGRETYKIDDFDYFVDYFVNVDGKSICNVYME